MKKQNFVYALMVTATVAFLAGCGKDNPTNPVAEASVTEDAAESIASAVGQDDGGALDQMSDVADITSAAGINDAASAGKSASILSHSIDTTWNPATSTWTLTLQRQRGTGTGTNYANVTRVYQYQFLNKDWVPQKYWRVPNGTGVDTAYTLKFTVVSGTGEHHTAHLSQHLTSVSGDWTITGANTATLTINGSYSRSAVDTVMTRNATRTLDHTLNLIFTNVQVPRGSRDDLAQHATGTISGTYNATITFSRGALYNDRTVSREFTLALGSGKGNVAIGGKAFKALLKSGELE
jgi:hypothetical protein